MITPEELDHLEAVAENASQNEDHWGSRQASDLISFDSSKSALSPIPLVPGDENLQILPGANAAFIDTFKPTQVRRLLAEIRSLRSALGQTSGEVEDLRMSLVELAQTSTEDQRV